MKGPPQSSFGAQVRAALDSRPPPHSPDAEKDLLGALIYEPAAFARVSGVVSSEDFYETRHQLLWGIIARSHGEGVVPDATILADLVGKNGVAEKIGGPAYLAELAARCPVNDLYIESHARIVKEHSVRRKVLAAGKALAEAAHTPGVDIAAFAAEETTYLREVLADLPGKAQVEPMVDLVDLLAMEFPPRPFLFEGWLHLRRTLVLYGDTHAGKSVTAWNMALCVARGHGAVFGSAVDPKARRAGLFLGENSLEDLKDGYGKILADEPAVQGQLFLYDVMAHPGEHKPDLGTDDGQRWYRRMIEHHRLEFVVFDTTTMLVGGDLSERALAIKVMRFFTALEKDLGCTVVAIAHPRKSPGKQDTSSAVDRLYGAGEWGNCSGALTYMRWEDPKQRDRIVVEVLKARGIPPSERMKPFVATLDEDTLQVIKLAEIGPGAAPGRRRAPGETAKGIVEKLHTCKEWLTAKDLAELLDVTPRAVNMTLSSKTFEKWIEQGFVEVEQANGPNPTKYRTTGALPPEFVS